MAFSEPAENLKHLHFPASGTVVDFGAGSGHYALVLAERLKDHHGKVIAVDIQRDLTEKLKGEAVRRNLDNLSTHWADVETMNGTALPDESMDAGVVSNILFQLAEKDVFCQEVFRVLRRNAELLVIDWTPTLRSEQVDSFAGMGPEQNAVISEAAVKNLFERHGFTLVERFDAGSHHYGMVFRKGNGN